jgi:hypothetical protein
MITKYESFFSESEKTMERNSVTFFRVKGFLADH